MSFAYSHNIIQNSTFNEITGNQYNCYHQPVDHERWAIVNWLSDLNFKEMQSDILANRTEGTGEWLLESQIFKGWLVGKSEVLWCPGAPGAGKTILTSIVVDYLQTKFRSEAVAVACIYCNYKEQTKQTIYELVASLLKQLVQDRSVAGDDVKRFYMEYHVNRKTRPKLPELMGVLQSEIRTYSQVYIAIDALDEYLERDRGDLVAKLRSLPSNVNLMVTSRPLPSIEQQFKDADRLDISANDDDVRKYIVERIPHENRLARHVKKDPTLQENMVDNIVGNAKGMFLLAKLHVDSLVSKSNLRAVRDALAKLPAGINDTYDEAMERIRRQVKDDRTLAERVLSWITYARRPLSQAELQHALAVTPEMTDMDCEALVDEMILVDVCAGLVVIDDNRSIIRLVHYTTQEYFERNRVFLFPGAHADIALTCLRYLSFDQFGKGHGGKGWWSFQESNPFLEYAAQNWGHHASDNVEETCKEMALKFFRHNLNVVCASKCLSWCMLCTSGIHLSAFFGLERIMQDQLDIGVDADLKTIHGYSPLLIAAIHGHEGVVRLLIARDDVDVDLKDYAGRTPLSLAAEKGYEGVVGLLVARDDVEINSKDSEGQTPLSLAAKNGHEEVVGLLVARGDVEINSKDRYGRTPLSLAAENGHEGVAGLLVARDDVEINSKDNDGRTPLSWAAKCGCEGVVGLLIGRHDIEINSKDTDSQTPLLWAAKCGHEEVVRLLVAQDDADADSKDNMGRTPLSWAAENGHEGVVGLLLVRDDVEVDSKDNGGGTPLSWAAAAGKEGVVRLLVVRDDVEINSKDSNGRTPLSWAAKCGHAGVVRLLVAQDDVDADSKDNMGRTPLSWAAGNGHEGVVELFLVQDDVEVNSKDNDGGTPLSWAAAAEREGVVRLLVVQDDVKVGSKEDIGQTSLSWAAGNRHKRMVRLLVARDDVGADSKDNMGWTPLLWATGNGQEGW